MAKSDRIVIRLEPDARAKLKARASALGLDEAAFARMLIYREINELAPAAIAAAPTREPRAVGAVGESRRPHAAPPPAAAEPELELADEARADEMEIPADADDGAEYSHEEYAAAAAAPAGASLEELLQAGPSMLDQMLLARTQPRQDTQNQPPPLMSTQRARQGYQAPLSRRQGTMPSYGPGSRTRPVGVNDMAIGGNTMGDGRGNVLRDNMRHFGIVGSRSR